MGYFEQYKICMSAASLFTMQVSPVTHDVWKCPMCTAVYCTLFDQVSHIRSTHNRSVISSENTLSCPVNGCSSLRHFKNTAMYYRHVRKQHHDLYLGYSGNKSNDSFCGKTGSELDAKLPSTYGSEVEDMDTLDHCELIEIQGDENDEICSMEVGCPVEPSVEPTQSQLIAECESCTGTIMMHFDAARSLLKLKSDYNLTQKA